jgi:hypothetical protein
MLLTECVYTWERYLSIETLNITDSKATHKTRRVQLLSSLNVGPFKLLNQTRKHANNVRPSIIQC